MSSQRCAEPPRFPGRRPLTVDGFAWARTLQFMLVGATALLVIAPPSDGTMLIVPILPSDAAVTLGWALPAGALLVAPGPYAGSFVVTASRQALLSTALAHGSIVLAARISGCSAKPRPF